MERAPVHLYEKPGKYSVTLIEGYSPVTTIITNDDLIRVSDGITSFPLSARPPLDPNGDGLYEDVNGDGFVNFQDVIDYFKYMEWIADNEPGPAFDYDRDGSVTFADVMGLFRILPDSGILTPVPTPVPTTVPQTTIPTTVPTTKPPTTPPTTIPTIGPTTKPPTSPPTTIPATVPDN